MQIKVQKLLVSIDLPQEIEQVEDWDDLMDPSINDAADVMKLKGTVLSNMKIEWEDVKTYNVDTDAAID